MDGDVDVIIIIKLNLLFQFRFRFPLSAHKIGIGMWTYYTQRNRTHESNKISKFFGEGMNMNLIESEMIGSAQIQIQIASIFA